MKQQISSAELFSILAPLYSKSCTELTFQSKKNSYNETMKTRKRFNPLLAGILVMLLSLSGCFLLPKEEEQLAPPLMATPEITYDLIPVIRGDIKNTLEVSGYFVSRRRTSLYFAPYNGYLKEVYVHVGSQVKEGDILAEVSTKALEDRYQLQVLALQKEELNFRKSSTSGVSDVDRELARIKLEEQKLLTEQAYDNLMQAQILAPFDGEIVFRDFEYSRGDEIPAYHPLLQIAPPGTLEILYEGSQMDRFYLGMEVQVEIKGNLGTYYRAEVIQTPKDTPKIDSDEYSGMVFFRLIDDVPGIRRGTDCTISAVLQESDNTLLVPKNLVKENNSVSYVYVLKDELPKEQPVVTGVRSSLYVEILEGLSEDDLLINR